MYDTIRLEGRFQECAAEGGAYKSAGAEKEFVSYLLCLKDPNSASPMTPNRKASNAVARRGIRT